MTAAAGIGEKETKKLILLDPEVAPDFQSLNKVMSRQKSGNLLTHFGITERNFKYHLIDFHYDLFNADTVLTWILPDDVGMCPQVHIR